MRPLPLALATALAVAAPLAGTSHAIETCKAVATPPVFVPQHGAFEADGTFGCAAPATGMTVTVCTQELIGGVLGAQWWTHTCTTTGPVAGATQTVTAHVVDTNIPLTATLLRTTVDGTNDSGVHVSSQSAPSPWFNCACMP